VTGILAPVVFAMHLSVCAKQYPVVLQAPVQRYLAHASVESGMRLTAIHDNTTGQSFFPDTMQDAVALARKQLAAGHRIDAGVMQVASGNWPAYGLTVETAFDPRANICAGARILGEAFQIERRAACRYNAGRPDCGNQYPELVQRAEASLVQIAPEPPQPTAAAPPPPPPEPLPEWDAFARARRARVLSTSNRSGIM
jgi:transglycosylase-like protein with SLT domain